MDLVRTKIDLIIIEKDAYAKTNIKFYLYKLY